MKLVETRVAYVSFEAIYLPTIFVEKSQYRVSLRPRWFHGGAGLSGCFIGSLMRKVVPSPTLLSTSMRPL
jgi:hypothetical protein